MLHLQIQQGKLLPYGRIDPSTVRWVPLDDFKITDVANGPITEGTDYIALKFESRNMGLDDISVDEGENENRVVTGEQHLPMRLKFRFFQYYFLVSICKSNLLTLS